MLSILAPAGAVYAFLFVGQLDFAGTIGIADVNVPQGVVFLDILVTDTVKNRAPVRGELGIGETPESEEHFRRHHSVVYLYLRNGRFFRGSSGAGCCNHHCKD